MIEDLRERIDKIAKRIDNLQSLLEIKSKEDKVADIENRMSAADFWKDSNRSQKIVQELKAIKNQVQVWHKLNSHCSELKDLLEISSDDDTDIISQISKDLEKMTSDLDALELKTLFSGKYDINNAILSINAGAGGTEACDWAGMLLRMYTRWAESQGFKFSTVDILAGEEAGIKNVTVRVVGDYAYGNLRSESGVHRLVRISPFDANKRRHTSFASVDAIPEVTEDIDIQVKEEELRVDTFRSSGAGGQHVNVTDSAIRITHLPSGIVVSCQNERSQHQNKHTALNILKARLFELKQKEMREQLDKIQQEKRKIEWGSQIRSYVMHPYNMVKDHRTNAETGNVQAVMDGRIDSFIAAYLKKFRR